MVEDGWKLIHNVHQAPDVPEFELFDHAEDPFNLTDVAADHSDIVARLSQTLETWKAMALAAKPDAEQDTQGLSQEELERLRSLGYIR